MPQTEHWTIRFPTEIAKQLEGLQKEFGIETKTELLIHIVKRMFQEGKITKLSISTQPEPSMENEQSQTPTSQDDMGRYALEMDKLYKEEQEQAKQQRLLQVFEKKERIKTEAERERQKAKSFRYQRTAYLQENAPHSWVGIKPCASPNNCFHCRKPDKIECIEAEPPTGAPHYSTKNLADSIAEVPYSYFTE